MSKILVAYFSCSGVTKKLALNIAKVVQGDLFEIEPVVPYTQADLNWNNKKSRSSVEMEDKSSRPEIASRVEMEQYDIVYVGFPIWWYIAPTIVNTFLERYDFSGKTVIPFATSGSSGVGETDKYLHGSCSKDTNWKLAYRFPNSWNEGTIVDWITSLNL